ncbi:MAG: hypothetical protein WBA28_04155 [Microbacteriaceae bacterium]
MMKPSPRLGWMFPAGLSLLAGLDAALILLGFPAPITLTRLAESHGMLLVLGFIGTLIALERSVALGRWYGYIGPMLLGFGALLVLVDPLPIWVGKAALTAGSAAFMLTYVPLWRRRYGAQILAQILGTSFALTASIMWLSGSSMTRLIPWLTAFVVLTIAAERVELATITLGNGAGARLLVHSWTVALALIIGLAFPHLGAIALGLAYLALALWLVRNDIARYTVRAKGAVRFMAACMLGGYFWLIVGGVILLLGYPTTVFAYDGFTHAIFLGYTMSMIMAHSTTILPAVLRIQLPYRGILWLPAGLLHLGLIVRILWGDAFGFLPAWQWGGVLTIVALLVFVLSAITCVFAGPAKTEGGAGQESSTKEPNPARNLRRSQPSSEPSTVEVTLD